MPVTVRPVIKPTGLPCTSVVLQYSIPVRLPIWVRSAVASSLVTNDLSQVTLMEPHHLKSLVRIISPPSVTSRPVFFNPTALRSNDEYELLGATGNESKSPSVWRL